MMTGPRDELEAGRGHLRASHADREQVIGVLKAAFVQGRLERDEFDLRVSQALASRTYAELATVTGDLPAGLAAAQQSAPARRSVNKKKKATAALTFATLAIAGHPGRSTADTGRVAFCRTGHLGLLPLVYRRIDRVDAAAPRMA